MAVITTGNHPKLLWPGIYALWGAKYNDIATEYTELFDLRNSTKAWEEVQEITGFGLVPVRTEGSASTYDDHVQGATARFVHVAYSLGYIVTREELADGQYEEVSRSRVSALALSANQTRENVGAQIYNRAFSSSYTGPDGVSLLNTAHPDATGNTQSNKLATDADFSEASLEDLTIQIMGALNARGLRISLLPQTLVGPIQLVYEFQRVLQSTLQPDTANNTINALKSMGVIPRCTTNHYLTDTDAWFIRTNAPEGLIWFDRDSADLTRDTDFDTDNAKAKLYMRFSAGWADWRALFGTQGA
jgi:hypothetical protein